MLPPSVYLQQVDEPHFNGRTNSDLLAWALDMRKALRQANSDKNALRQWSAGQAADSDLTPQP